MSTAVSAFLALCGMGGLLLWRAHVYAVACSIVEAMRDAQGQANRFQSPRGWWAQASSRRCAYWGSGGIVAVLVRLLGGGVLDIGLFAFLILGAVLGEILWRRSEATQRRHQIRLLEFFIPTVMERVVMAVGAGLDIVPAMTEAADGADDPASLFLRRVVALTNSGLSLEDALVTATAGIDCPSLKHLSVHLSLAYRQGGELVRPLRELSDATQLQYQEIIEEEIAKLPVKAVLPLVLTFAGLIVCFLTVPLIQVGTIVSKVADVAE